jgi:hypothetical protein
VKTKTLNNYRERVNAMMRAVTSVFNGMNRQDDRFERTNKVFNRCLEMSNFLHGDEIKGDTIEISSRLQALERTVQKWQNNLPEDDAVVAEKANDLEAIILAVPIPEGERGSVKQRGIMKMKDAQQALMDAHQIFCSENKVVRYLSEVKNLEDYSRGLNPILQGIIKVDF